MEAEYPEAITPLTKTFVSRTTFRMARLAYLPRGFYRVFHDFIFADMGIRFANGIDRRSKLPRDGRTVKVFVQQTPERDFFLRGKATQSLFDLV